MRSSRQHSPADLGHKALRSLRERDETLPCPQWEGLLCQVKRVSPVRSTLADNRAAVHLRCRDERNLSGSSRGQDLVVREELLRRNRQEDDLPKRVLCAATFSFPSFRCRRSQKRRVVFEAA